MAASVLEQVTTLLDNLCLFLSTNDNPLLEAVYYVHRCMIKIISVYCPKNGDRHDYTARLALRETMLSARISARPLTGQTEISAVIYEMRNRRRYNATSAGVWPRPIATESKAVEETWLHR